MITSSIITGCANNQSIVPEVNCKVPVPTQSVIVYRNFAEKFPADEARRLYENQCELDEIKKGISQNCNDIFVDEVVKFANSQLTIQEIQSLNKMHLSHCPKK
jgi:hypothetical protein